MWNITFDANDLACISATGCAKRYPNNTRAHTHTYIGDDREDSHSIEDLQPGPNASGLGSHGPAKLGGELPGIHTHLQDVIT